MASSAVSQSHSGQLHHHAPAAGSMMARVDRLDLVVGYLEEMRHHGSARSSTSPSTPTTLSSSSPTTPRSTSGPGRCRPAEELLRETRAKGSLVERIAFLENRVLRMEEGRLEEERMSMEMSTPERTGRLSSSMDSGGGGSGTGSGRKKKGLKSLVKSCVRGGAKLKTKD